ncbi:MAG: riboflavin synthase [Alphaproteobacteria bacterium]
MFTGVVTHLGRVRAIEKSGDTRIEIAPPLEAGVSAVGASIACNGCCLTVMDRANGKDPWFAVTASAETLARTTLGGWKVGDSVNLEWPLKLGDELGGHIVMGHVDGVAEVLRVTPEGDSLCATVQAPRDLAKYIASKGSVALDGVAFTVNEVEGARFGINVIPHTAKMTTFGAAEAGMRLNLEVDILARYVARLRP